MRSSKLRVRDFLYLAWIKTQVCIVCERQRDFYPRKVYAHHAGARGLSQRADDRTALPLCWRHHDRLSPISIHSLGKRFWGIYGIERDKVIEELNKRYLVEYGSIASPAAPVPFRFPERSSETAG